MLTNLVTKDYFIANTINTPLYLVHSDRDDLRPMQMTKDVVNKLKSAGNKLLYKEYIGYEHYDKHLAMDMPNAVKFINSTIRNPYPSQIRWITAYDTIYNTCAWLKINKIDTLKPRASWDIKFNTKAFNKTDHTYYNRDYYMYDATTGAVKANYANNVFDIQTSRVARVQVLISPAMVDLEKPVVIKINGKEVYHKVVSADKEFLAKAFKQTADRQMLWVNAIDVNVD